jgi:arginyl-tRNA synthetase
MQNIVDVLTQKFNQALQRLYSGQSTLDPHLLSAEVAVSAHSQFGHYQFNNALRLGKALARSPREVAQEIISALEDEGAMLSKIEIAGPGFVNLTLSESFLAAQVTSLLKDERLGIDPPRHPKRVIVEFSSPNVAKELHVGHLRSTIIGDCLARLFEFLGHDVLRLNHIGDWGTQFGMLIAYMDMEVPEVLKGVQPTSLPQLMHWYRESKKRFDSDPEFKKRAQLKVVALQAGDADTVKAWKLICEISRLGFQEIYQLLDVKLVERGESFYNPFLQEIVSDLEQKQLVTVSDGARCVFLEGFETREGTPLPLIVQKADGGYNYATTDLASLRHRVTVERADRMIYVVDAGQSLHFQMVFKVAEKAGYYDPKKHQVDHVPFGVVLGADGKKFKTRSGETEKLIDLIYEAVKEAKNILQERLPDIDSSELKELSEILGVDAIKYADLSCHRLKDYLFSYERMLKFEGNTAAFLLYAFVRIQSIKRKVGKDVNRLIESSAIELVHPSEVALGLHLRRLGEILVVVERDLTPNRLCEYLYELAEKFHAFFRDCRVEGSPEETSRLLLCEATGRVLEKGLNILGLRTMQKM